MVRSNISFTGQEWMRSAAHASNDRQSKCDWFEPLLKLDAAAICVDSSLFFLFSFFFPLSSCSFAHSPIFFNYIASYIAICDNRVATTSLKSKRQDTPKPSHPDAYFGLSESLDIYADLVQLPRPTVFITCHISTTSQQNAFLTIYYP